MRIITILATILSIVTSSEVCKEVANNCISFSVTSGTGCAWMCNYCASQLGTNNFYFADGICSYSADEGTCIGNPIAVKQYQCCSL